MNKSTKDFVFSELVKSYEVEQEMNILKDYTNGGKCSNCGECCSDILPLTEKEILTIVNYISENKIKPLCKAVEKNGQINLHMICPFHDYKSKTCLIYEVRPKICREFQCSQTPTEMAENQMNCVICRDEKIIYISMHVTYLNDERYIKAIENDDKLSNMVQIVDFIE